MSKCRTQAGTGMGRLIGAESVSSYSGPIPHPDILRGLGEVDPSFPERVMKMAEGHARTEDSVQLKITSTNTASIILGQVFSFLFGIGGIGACVYLALRGSVGGAVVSGIAVIVQTVVAGLAGQRH